MTAEASLLDITGKKDPSVRVDLAVEGMTCRSCANRVERSIGRLPGVTQAGVNFATARASVRFDPAVTGLDDLAAAVAKSGYALRIDDQSGEDPRQHEETYSGHSATTWPPSRWRRWGCSAP